MHWLRLLNVNAHIITITVCAYLVGEHLFLFALYTVSTWAYMTSSSHFTSSVPVSSCWLDHPLICHSLMSARAHDLTIVNNKSFVIACLRLSTSGSFVNKFHFQNIRAGCTKHRIMSESFRATTGLVTTDHIPETSVHPSLTIRSGFDRSQDLLLVKKNPKNPTNKN